MGYERPLQCDHLHFFSTLYSTKQLTKAQSGGPQPEDVNPGAAAIPETKAKLPSAEWHAVGTVLDGIPENAAMVWCWPLTRT